jgi:hypothetical protein
LLELEAGVAEGWVNAFFIKHQPLFYYIPLVFR